jgi:dienelactone hydrolase
MRLFSALILSLAATTAFAQRLPLPVEPPINLARSLAPGQTCQFVTQAHAEASAGTANINHDGTPLAGQSAPDISRGFSGIPRSAQPRLTASQQRILECTYRLAEANADMPYTLFIPSTYDSKKPTPLVVDLHGLSITPLQQILFDGTTDFAERYGFIVLAPMGFNVSSWWGSRPGTPVPTAAAKPGGPGGPGGDVRYSTTELSEIDAMAALRMIREKYTIDSDRIYLMGHSMGGAGTYYLGGKYNEVWAGLAPISGANGIADAPAAARYTSIPMLIMHGDKDSIVAPATSRRSAMALQAVGAQHIYLEFPGKDHEFWIRRGAENMEKVFLFFNTVSKRTSVGPITPDKLPPAAGPPSGTRP